MLSLELFSTCCNSAPDGTSGPKCYRFHMCPVRAIAVPTLVVSRGPLTPPLPLSYLRFYPVRVLRGACMVPRLFLTRRTRPCSHSCTQYVPTLVPMLVHYTYHPCPLDTSPSPHLLVYSGYVLCPFTDFVRFPSFGILARAPRYSPHRLRCPHLLGGSRRDLRLAEVHVKVARRGVLIGHARRHLSLELGDLDIHIYRIQWLG
jgi:hypothetical protein